jgi:UDP-N-acetylmuramate--alanine ligase
MAVISQVDKNSSFIHFIGIGGIGMSGIAHLLLNKGYKVSGSDLKSSAITDKLSTLGARIFIGHSFDNIKKDCKLTVFSSAVNENNPEIIACRKQNIPIMRRADCLKELMQEKIVVAVAGAHGKTTTSSLISHILINAGLCPTVAIGGILKNIDDNAMLGDGKYFVAEADESDGSFLSYSPDYSVITNIDYEHVDFFKDLNNIRNAFYEFMENTKNCLFCCIDDKNIRDLLKQYGKRYFSFSLLDKADIYPKDIDFKELSSEFSVYYKNKSLGRVKLNLAGEHNISNSLAAVALGLELGIGFESICQSLSTIKGVERRLQIKARKNEITIIDDYAHHPSEIKATLKALDGFKRKRLMVIFQPHRYSRTRFLWEEFLKCFDKNIDSLIITDIYAASEKPILNISAQNLVKDFVDSGNKAMYLPKDEIVSFVRSVMKQGDLIVGLGAGDIYKINDELAESLKA